MKSVTKTIVFAHLCKLLSEKEIKEESKRELLCLFFEYAPDIIVLDFSVEIQGLFKNFEQAFAFINTHYIEGDEPTENTLDLLGFSIEDLKKIEEIMIQFIRRQNYEQWELHQEKFKAVCEMLIPDLVKRRELREILFMEGCSQEPRLMKYHKELGINHHHVFDILSDRHYLLNTVFDRRMSSFKTVSSIRRSRV